MSILDRLLSVLGLGGADDRGDREPTVTVEHDPDATDEAAVKGVDVGEGGGSGASDGTDVAGAGESDGDEGKPKADAAEARTETANADGTSDSDADESIDADVETGADADESTDADVETGADADAGEADAPIESAVEADDAGSRPPDPLAAEGADESVETVKGIGSAYADRLADIGVETLGDLATADAADLAEGTSLSEKRVSRWIDRARDRLDLD